jgi:hypothetical protein
VCIFTKYQFVIYLIMYSGTSDWRANALYNFLSYIGQYECDSSQCFELSPIRSCDEAKRLNSDFETYSFRND